MSSGMIVDVENGAQAYLELLRAMGVKYFFVNPGTDTAPINEAFAKFAAEGKDEPKLILSLHENLAASMAHGYAMVTGKPQVVMVHVTVGTANALGAIMNMHRSRIPVVFTAGRTPITEEGFEGSRDLSVHWGQESFDQGSLLREFTKWDYEVRLVEQLPLLVQRAFKIAMTAPPGPVYLILPREVLMKKLTKIALPSLGEFNIPSPINADPEALRKAADILLDAVNPVIVTGMLGDNPRAVDKLVELAEALAIPVIERPRERMNFPTEHPLHLGYDISPYMGNVDAIFLIDTDIPWLPKTTKPKEGAKIIQIDVDPNYTYYPVWGFRADLPIVADSDMALPALTSIIKDRLSNDKEKQRRILERYERIREEHNRQRKVWRESAIKVSNRKPIDFMWLSYVINEVKDDDTIIVNEYSLQPTQLQLKKPATYFRSSPMSSLGWGLGAAMGAKLAAPDKTVIACIGDGSYIFNVPIACHWVMEAYRIPILTVIFNNQCYNAVKRTIKDLFPNGWSMKTGKFIGVDLHPSPKYENIVKAVGGYGETVEDPEEIKPALLRALEIVKTGRQAVVDVICQRP